jgi:MarR family transcriptional regulator, organic hydroperoxide resistance regulator
MRATQHSESLTGLFARAQDALLTSFQAQLKSHGLSIVDWRVLKALRDEDGMRIIDLAERALSHQVTITHVIGRMERAGLVRRRVPSDDRRSRCVYLRERGRRVARQLATLERRNERAASRALGAPASRKLKSVLLRFIDSIEGSTLLYNSLGLPAALRQ